MKLVIGGCSQGKLHYVLQQDTDSRYLVLDARLPDEQEMQKIPMQGKVIVVNHFHTWVRTKMQQGENPEEEIKEFVRRVPGCTIISNEIGNGIVPIEAFEREYRERTGRILIGLAGQAEEVVRVICGIGQKIK